MSNIITKLKSIFVARETSLLEKSELLLMVGILISIFFPIRYVLENKFSNILGYYSDFTAISIYLSFFFILTFTIIGIYRSVAEKNSNPLLLKFFIAFILGLILYQVNLDPDFRIISAYFYLRISCVLLFGYYVYKSPIWLKYKGLLLWIVILIAAIQSIIALLQFYLQHSLGLNLLGESPLAPTLYGVAKIVSHGTTIIRGYGTLPHPNILGAFLVIASLLNLHLLNNNKQRINSIFLSITAFIIILGLFVTFSRSALLASGIGFVTWGIITLIKQKSLVFMRKIWIFPLAIMFSVWLFYPLLISRGNIQDESAAQRSIYNDAGIQILKNNWVIGTGPGTNMFHMKQKLQYQLEPWNIQPVHNYFLIMLSEWGIIGLFMSIFLLSTFYRISRKFLSGENLTRLNLITCWETTLIAISASLFTLFWFDHYLYTIWPAQVFLWLIIALTWKAILTKDNKSLQLED